jgi:hypothetical protein
MKFHCIKILVSLHVHHEELQEMPIVKINVVYPLRVLDTHLLTILKLRTGEVQCINAIMP